MDSKFELLYTYKKVVHCWLCIWRWIKK